MAKATNNYQRATAQIAKITRALIADFWNNEIPEPTVTIQSSDSTYGHCTNQKVWHGKDHSNGADVEDTIDTFEINLSAQWLNRDICECIATIQHELTHEYCRVNNLKEVSSNGYYHNKLFKEIAENHGLTISKDPRYGWTLTEPGIEIIEFAERHSFGQIELSRNCEGSWTWTYGGTGNKPTTPPTTTKKGNSIKMICPQCGAIARITKSTIHIGCWDCMCEMIEA